MKHIKINEIKLKLCGFEITRRGIDGYSFTNQFAPISVIISEAREKDKKWWIHLSIAHKNRVLTFKEIKEYKELFIGDKYCYMVFPPKIKYVNIHPNCYHLFYCVDREQYLPEFSGFVNGKRTL